MRCKPDVSHLHEFGATCWVLRQDSSLDKLARKSHLCRFLGFSKESRAYRLYDPNTRQVVTSLILLVSRPVLYSENQYKPVGVGKG